MTTTTFFTASNRLYWPFVAPYAASVLATNADALAEVCVEAPEHFLEHHGPAVNAVHKQFPGRFHIRCANFDGLTPNAVRFTETPERRGEYTYIGDVDILVVEPDITAQHLRHMELTGLPYSNVIRPGQLRLTGLHFTRSDFHYPILIPDDADPGLSDEAFLYEIVAARDAGLPDPADTWRPTHGIHLSLNRVPVASAGQPNWAITLEHAKRYLALRASPAWGSVARHFHPAYRYLLLVLDASIQGRFPDLGALAAAEIMDHWKDLSARVAGPATIDGQNGDISPLA